MATLSLTILPAKALKGGKHKVRVAVAHNSTTRYIVTDVIIDSEKEWKNGRVVKRPDATFLNTRLAKIMADTQRDIDAVPYIEGLSCAELLDAMRTARGAKFKTLRGAFDEFLDVATCKESSKRTYRLHFARIIRHIPETQPVAGITPLMVRKLIAEMMKTMSGGTVSRTITLLSSILLHCQRNGYTDFRVLPTDGIKRPQPEIRQNWLSPDQVRLIRDVQTDKVCLHRFRDIFMLSYYLGGINLIDMAKINFRECGTHIRYVRTKTDRRVKANHFVEFDMPHEALEIIGRLMKDDGHVELWNARHKENLCTNIGQYSRIFRDVYNIPDLTYYSARKSFAQHAFNLGVSESVIDYILGHSLGNSKSCLYSYIKVTPAMSTAAIRKVCDFLASSEKFD